MSVVESSSVTRFSSFSRLAAGLISKLPTPVRFLAVGSVGLASDMGVFSALDAAGLHALMARGVSLAVATLVTWRLNRALTFGQTGRRQRAEAMRYASVTAVAQGVSYLTFAGLVVTVARDTPLLAILAGAVLATVFSYNGHRLFSFAGQARKPESVS